MYLHIQSLWLNLRVSPRIPPLLGSHLDLSRHSRLPLCAWETYIRGTFHWTDGGWMRMRGRDKCRPGELTSEVRDHGIKAFPVSLGSRRGPGESGEVPGMEMM